MMTNPNTHEYWQIFIGDTWDCLNDQQIYYQSFIIIQNGYYSIGGVLCVFFLFGPKKQQTYFIIVIYAIFINGWHNHPFETNTAL